MSQRSGKVGAWRPCGAQQSAVLNSYAAAKSAAGDRAVRPRFRPANRWSACRASKPAHQAKHWWTIPGSAGTSSASARTSCRIPASCGYRRPFLNTLFFRRWAPSTAHKHQLSQTRP